MRLILQSPVYVWESIPTWVPILVHMLLQGIPVHIDGARIFNAATALGVPVSEITQHVTTVQLCLSKVPSTPDLHLHYMTCFDAVLAK